MRSSIAIFSKTSIHTKILKTLDEIYDNVFYSHFSGSIQELTEYPYIHYWYVQNKNNIDILIDDIFEIEKVWRDNHKIVYSYKKGEANSLDIYSKYIDGFVAEKTNAVTLETFNKPCIYY